MASRGHRVSLPRSKKNRERKKTARIKVVFWNIRILQDSGDRPHRRSEFVARELARLDIDIAAHGGKNKVERRLSGVGFMVKTSIPRKLQNLPTGHSDRLMSLRLSNQDNTFDTVPKVCTHQLCRLKYE